MNFFLILFVSFICSTWTIVNNPSNKCVEERNLTRVENITRMINVSETISEFCLSISEVFQCDKQVTHFIPRTVEETRTRLENVTVCCQGYESDGEDDCVPEEIEASTDDFEGSVEDTLNIEDYNLQETVTEYRTNEEDSKDSIEENIDVSDEAMKKMDLMSDDNDVKDISVTHADKKCVSWMWGEDCSKVCECHPEGTR